VVIVPRVIRPFGMNQGVQRLGTEIEQMPVQRRPSQISVCRALSSRKALLPIFVFGKFIKRCSQFSRRAKNQIKIREAVRSNVMSNDVRLRLSNQVSIAFATRVRVCFLLETDGAVERWIE
jgi:hypothetical protein